MNSGGGCEIWYRSGFAIFICRWDTARRMKLLTRRVWLLRERDSCDWNSHDNSREHNSVGILSCLLHSLYLRWHLKRKFNLMFRLQVSQHIFKKIIELHSRMTYSYHVSLFHGSRSSFARSPSLFISRKKWTWSHSFCSKMLFAARVKWNFFPYLNTERMLSHKGPIMNIRRQIWIWRTRAIICTFGWW